MGGKCTTKVYRSVGPKDILRETQLILLMGCRRSLLFQIKGMTWKGQAAQLAAPILQRHPHNRNLKLLSSTSNWFTKSSNSNLSNLWVNHRGNKRGQIRTSQLSVPWKCLGSPLIRRQLNNFDLLSIIFCL